MSTISLRVHKVLLFFWMMLQGCSGSVADRPKTYPVTGQVAYKGKPLEGATVAFWTEKSPRAAQGITDAEGKFTLSTFALNDGAIAGDHKITVTKVDASAAAQSAPTTLPSNPAELTDVYVQRWNSKTLVPKAALPAIYGKVETTPLSAPVKPEGNDPIVLQLTD